MALRDQLMTSHVKTEVKTETTDSNEINITDYLAKFETEAAGYLVDELPQAFVSKFLAHVRQIQGKKDDELDPFKI
jgi:hypothetical protein